MAGAGPGTRPRGAAGFPRWDIPLAPQGLGHRQGSRASRGHAVPTTPCHARRALLRAGTVPGSLAPPSPCPPRCPQRCHQPVPAPLSRRPRWPGIRRQGRAGGCAAVPASPPGARGGGPGGRRGASGAERGGGGRWLPASPPVPGIRRWLRAPRARHNLLARPRGCGEAAGEAPSPFPGRKESRGSCGLGMGETEAAPPVRPGIAHPQPCVPLGMPGVPQPEGWWLPRGCLSLWDGGSSGKWSRCPQLAPSAPHVLGALHKGGSEALRSRA